MQSLTAWICLLFMQVLHISQIVRPFDQFFSEEINLSNLYRMLSDY